MIYYSATDALLSISVVRYAGARFYTYTSLLHPVLQYTGASIMGTPAVEAMVLAADFYYTITGKVVVYVSGVNCTHITIPTVVHFQYIPSVHKTNIH
jgi:hypothetical protein